MTRGVVLLSVASVSAMLLVAGLLTGPKLAAGAVVGLAVAVAIYRYPILGLGLMILTGTALQVLGSEHLTGLPLSLGKVAGMVTLIAWVARSVLDREPMTWSPQIVAFLLFFAAIALAGVIAPNPDEGREAVFRYAQLFLLFFMIANIAGQSARLLDQAVIAFTASMALSSLIGLAEFLLPALSIESDDPALIRGSIGAVVDNASLDGVEIKRITGGLGDSNWFSYALVSVLPLNLYLFRRYARPLGRTLILAATALQSMCVVLSFTRSAVMALGVATLVLLWRRRLPLKPLLVAAGIGLSAFLVWNPAGLERLYSVEYAKVGSTPLRSWMLYGGIELIQERPITGYGYNQYGANFLHWLGAQPNLGETVEVWEREFERAVAAGEERPEWVMPHNTLIQVWVEFGLLGVLAFAGFILALMRDIGICRRVGTPAQSELADCLLAATFGFLVCAMFGHLLLLKVIWILGGFAAALCRVAVTDAATGRGEVGEASRHGAV